jgi:hypothetical protein
MIQAARNEATMVVMENGNLAWFVQSMLARKWNAARSFLASIDGDVVLSRDTEKMEHGAILKWLDTYSPSYPIIHGKCG